MSKKGWERFKQALPVVKTPSKRGGRPPCGFNRSIERYILYGENGCSWRSLPHDFPRWQTVYGYFSQWSKDGSWEAINAFLGEKARVKSGCTA
ncbi:transposase [Pontibacter russatus]|uniref:transposase n=1 Tax=Pontibacter russatus TaxID=2694929 RepID=UPI00137A9B2A|nr:transposase [Pontibacter russatus]